METIQQSYLFGKSNAGIILQEKIETHSKLKSKFVTIYQHYMTLLKDLKNTQYPTQLSCVPLIKNNFLLKVSELELLYVENKNSVVDMVVFDYLRNVIIMNSKIALKHALNIKKIEEHHIKFKVDILNAAYLANILCVK